MILFKTFPLMEIKFHLSIGIKSYHNSYTKNNYHFTQLLLKPLIPSDILLLSINYQKALSLY